MYILPPSIIYTVFLVVRRICRLGCQDINIPGSFRKIYDHEISHFKSHLERASSPDACILQLLYIPSLEPVRKSHHTVMWFENVMLHTYVWPKKHPFKIKTFASEFRGNSINNIYHKHDNNRFKTLKSFFSEMKINDIIALLPKYWQC